MDTSSSLLAAFGLALALIARVSAAQVPGQRADFYDDFTQVKPVSGVALSRLGDDAPDRYLNVPLKFIDAMLANGRDVYGEEHSPLLATTLDRKTMKLLPPQLGGNKKGSRGANPQRDAELYRTMYLVSALTGEQKYAREADAILKFFFTTTAHPTTGFFTWGEHTSWNFETDAPAGHPAYDEFWRNWPLWNASWSVCPKPMEKWANALWYHVWDKETGNWNHHAHYDNTESISTQLGMEWARHGSYYVTAWSQAYQRTTDGRYLKYIETVVRFWETVGNKDGLVTLTSPHHESGYRFDFGQCTQVSVNLGAAAHAVPSALAARMDKLACRIDQEVMAKHGGPHAAVVMWERYRQTNKESYREYALEQVRKFARGEQFAVRKDDLSRYSASSFALAIRSLLIGYHATGEARYLKLAQAYADEAIIRFWPDDSPLPRISQDKRTDPTIYDAGTGTDGLTLSLVMLWAELHGRHIEPQWVYEGGH